MSDPGFLYWLGGLAVIVGMLGLIGVLAVWIDFRVKRRMERKGRAWGTYHDTPHDPDDPTRGV